jgi:hypothetical protein
MFDRMFSQHYEFDFLSSHRYNVNDFTPATGNGEHKHSDVAEGIQQYSANFELIAEDDDRRRGSDTLFLVNDKYYVWCSITGMEQSGNVIEFSENSPFDLRFKVMKTIFGNILSQNFGEIKNGVSATEIKNTGMKVMSVKAFLLKSELNEDERETYFDRLAEYTVELIEKFHTVDTIEEMKKISEWYSDQETQLYRELTDFEPTIASQVVNNSLTIDRDEWFYPKRVDENKSIVLFQKREDPPEYYVEINELGEENNVHAFKSIENKVDKIVEATYENQDELKQYIEDFTSKSVEEL